jgi:hypothetical protein
MIVTRRLRAPLKLEAKEVRAALGQISCESWSPALLGTEHQLLRAAGLPPDVPWSRVPMPLAGTRLRARAAPGDVFFRDEGVYYLISRGVLEDPYLPASLGDAEEAYVELGAIGEAPEPLDAGLAELTVAVEAALRATLDGRRVRYMRFEWVAPQPTGSRLAQVRATELGDGTTADVDEVVEDPGPAQGTSFEKAELDDDTVRAADTMATPGIREFLQEISRAGFARERDLKQRWDQRNRWDEAAGWIADSRSTGILATEYLLECKNSGEQIIRLKDRTQLESGGHGGLVHASCGRTFAEENVSEGYSLSPLGQKLVQKSHWMTVWVTDRLRAAGIPMESILWNLSESGEEVDILLEFLNEIWIFELKDRTFSAGDAYPFNYRRSRYGADGAFIVTTDHVASDARRVFDELFDQSAATPRFPKPTYVEGLAKLEATLREHVARLETSFAGRQLTPLATWSGYDLRRIVLERLARRTTTAASKAKSTSLVKKPREAVMSGHDGGS